MAIILAINAGSSSVKASVYKAIATEPPEQLAEVQIAGLTALPASLTYERGSEKIQKKELENIKGQEDAFEYVLQHLIEDETLSEINTKDDISYTCHRVVHGGDYPAAHVIDSETYHHLEELTDLAPLHNASALAIVKFCSKTLPNARNMAFFDTSFHATIPQAISTYPIDSAIASKNRLRKYGFHGISYAFITRSVAEYLKKDQRETNIIALHLGSGASVCAVRNGESLDTSMGLTPLDGLPGATRSGSVDPSLIFHFTHDAGKPSPNSSKELHISTAEEILNKKSGWKALTGTTDFGQVSSSSDPKFRLAFDIFVDRIIGYIGSYYVKLEGRVDALVFAGGIGEKGSLLRATIVRKCACLGFELDQGQNEASIEDTVQSIGQEGARHQTLVCQTDEQFEMARQCVANSML